MAGVPILKRPKLTVKMQDTETMDIFNDGILTNLRNDRGIIFPYTPTLTSSFGANYGSIDTTHSVSQQQYYMNTPNPTITIQANFTANTTTEALHTVASLHFLKTMTKMDFGVNAKHPGMPPPILHFSAYGEYNYSNVPVIVTQIDYTFPEDGIDYVTVDISGSQVSSLPIRASAVTATIPVAFVVSITLLVQQTPSNVSDNFSFKQYANGNALKGGLI